MTEEGCRNDEPLRGDMLRGDDGTRAGLAFGRLNSYARYGAVN